MEFTFQVAMRMLPRVPILARRRRAPPAGAAPRTHRPTTPPARLAVEKRAPGH